MFNLSNVISFFEENINDTKYQFKSLNSIQQKTNSDFIKDSVIQTLYSYISEYKLPFNVFMSNPDVTAFLNDYNASLDRYKSHESEIQKLNDILLGNDTNISNKNDLISYVIIESLIDFYDSKKYVIHKNNNKTGFYNKYFDEIIELESSYDFISSFESKPYGFYICKLPFHQHSTFFYGHKYVIISNQPNAIYCYELNNDIKVKHGFNLYNLEIKNDIFRKNHNFKIEINENSKSELSTYSNDSIFKDTITKLVFKCFLYWAESMKEETFEKGYIGYNKSDNKSNFPVVSNLDSKEIRSFSFEELKFKGEYSFLSFLDDLFEDIIDMQYINYFADNVNKIHLIKHVSDNIQFDFDKNYSFDKYFFNQFEINIVDKLPLDKLKSHERGFSLTPINPYYFGTENDIKEYNFNIAKLNKLRIYYMYVKLYFKKHVADFEKEMQSFFIENVNNFVTESDFINLVSKFATGNISNRNVKENFLYAQLPTIVAVKDIAFRDRSEKFYSIKDVEELDIIDYKSKAKAKKLIGFDISNLNIWSYFEENFDLNFSKETEFFISLFKSFHLLENIVNDKGIEKVSDILAAFPYKSVDVELYKWIEFDRLIRVFVPMSNKNYKEYMTILEEVDHPNVINCNFGYGNGSHWFG